MAVTLQQSKQAGRDAERAGHTSCHYNVFEDVAKLWRRGAMRDLRSFLADAAKAVWHLNAGVDLRHELTALQHELDRHRRFPILHAHGLRDIAGRATDISAVTNLTASRELHGPCARHP